MAQMNFGGVVECNDPRGISVGKGKRDIKR